MERNKFAVMKIQCVLATILLLVQKSLTWQVDLRANLHLDFSDLHGVQVYQGESGNNPHYKLIEAEKESMLLGARNKMYNISMATLEENVLERIEWEPRDFDKKVCLTKMKTEEECQNHIRVIGKKPSGELFVCGTNAFKPKCRSYVKSEEMTYVMSGEEKGVGQCAFDPRHNSTYVFSDGKLFSATVSDFSERDPLIFSTSNGPSGLRTEQHDSKWLNDPNFVGSFDIKDKIYFFFRETAVEHINCGKTVFSRVARICKNDRGGQIMMKSIWTSFFKARLNCSIPGEYPFYLDEIQSTSEMGQGNYMSTDRSDNRTDMFYAVFRTPSNSIQGSAVCAFKLADIEKTFMGKFKGQESTYHNWLPISHPNPDRNPHPSICVNDSYQISEPMLNFIKSHTLMDPAVPSAGGSPLIVLPTFKGRMTQIAVDWQVHAGDGRYYDVIFVGTDDGRVLKVVNKGQGSKVETVVIEDIKVFPDGYAVTGLKIYRANGKEKLIVISKEKVISVPLHQCEHQESCRSCVRLQDPYCSWVDDKCAASDRGIQSILTGAHSGCGPEEKSTLSPSTTSKPKEVSNTEKPQCNCQCPNNIENVLPGVHTTKKPDPPPQVEVEDELDIDMSDFLERKPNLKKIELFQRLDVNNQNKDSELKPSSQEVRSSPESSLSVAETAIAIVVSIVLSSILSFLAGYWVRSCRSEPQENQLTNEEIYGSLQKNHNKLKDNEPRYVNHAQLERNNSQKQLNLIVTNIQKGSNLPNGGALQKPVLNIPVPDKTYV
ncbi:semaphorin-1A-like isoform X1 [Crassostrea angulata]|nr:semaphorin-1A-like isoform X1 [Crassostrea angulata]XP_052696849.1 semaphorin-1A-like isoform X1 [Crassostrea angulata]|eukprot:XP_011451933.1 PREDICTED: semaphorin-1A isoform X1 [Crassostrea gigas]